MYRFEVPALAVSTVLLFALSRSDTRLTRAEGAAHLAAYAAFSPSSSTAAVRRRGFPYLVFYAEREADIDLWRALHAARNMPARLQEPLED